MSNKPAVSQAKMDRMRRVIERAGLPFRGFKTHPDGAVEALVGDAAPLTSANDAGPSDPLDAELAAWDAKHGHG